MRPQVALAREFVITPHHPRGSKSARPARSPRRETQPPQVTIPSPIAKEQIDTLVYYRDPHLKSSPPTQFRHAAFVGRSAGQLVYFVQRPVPPQRYPLLFGSSHRPVLLHFWQVVPSLFFAASARTAPLALPRAATCLTFNTHVSSPWQDKGNDAGLRRVERLLTSPRGSGRAVHLLVSVFLG